MKRPGRFVLESDLTVSGAVSLAGGLTRFGSQGLKLRRVDVGDRPDHDHRGGPQGRAQRQAARSAAAAERRGDGLAQAVLTWRRRCRLRRRRAARSTSASTSACSGAGATSSPARRVVGLVLGLVVRLRADARVPRVHHAADRAAHADLPERHRRPGGRRELLAERRLLQHAVQGAHLEGPRREGGRAAEAQGPAAVPGQRRSGRAVHGARGGRADPGQPAREPGGHAPRSQGRGALGQHAGRGLHRADALLARRVGEEGLRVAAGAAGRHPEEHARGAGAALQEPTRARTSSCRRAASRRCRAPSPS